MISFFLLINNFILDLIGGGLQNKEEEQGKSISIKASNSTYIRNNH